MSLGKSGVVVLAYCWDIFTLIYLVLLVRSPIQKSVCFLNLDRVLFQCLCTFRKDTS